ncbi:hypothetical protein [Pedobacter nanyangensis]|uniref:hypothetical protein n=1 Tax=Pedobacter nanyangensis TaxID=1562389 RepID=UPI000DE4F917|nr:hypothetical protein [Pedobacter nanyangensis]
MKTIKYHVMKYLKFWGLMLSVLCHLGVSAQTGVNTKSPDPSSNLTVDPLRGGAPRGTLLSAMTSAQRLAIASPATGLLVYDLDLKCLMSNNGTPAAPVWSCIGSGSSATSTGVFIKHFHYALPNNIPKSTADFSARSGPVTANQTLLSNWLATNDAAQVAQLPMMDGIRLDIEFYDGTYYRSLIVNTNSTAVSLAGVTDMGISNKYQWSLPLSLPANNYFNIDSDQILGWSSQGVLERSEAVFRILGDNGALYKITFYGYNSTGNTSGKYHIHLILEKFDPQSGGVHN